MGTIEELAARLEGVARELRAEWEREVELARAAAREQVEQKERRKQALVREQLAKMADCCPECGPDGMPHQHGGSWYNVLGAQG